MYINENIIQEKYDTKRQHSIVIIWYHINMTGILFLTLDTVLMAILNFNGDRCTNIESFIHNFDELPSAIDLLDFLQLLISKTPIYN